MEDKYFSILEINEIGKKLKLSKFSSGMQKKLD